MPQTVSHRCHGSSNARSIEMEAEIAEKYELVDAWTVSDIALEYGISTDEVHRIAARLQAKTKPQPHLVRIELKMADAA